MSQPDYDDDLFFQPQQKYIKIEKEVFDVILSNSTKYLAMQDNILMQQPTREEFKQVIKALITASPSHLRWVEKNWKDYL